ncbi:MAG: hypothetical protein ABR606_04795, partial [Vicinamibacterales bacterium]
SRSVREEVREAWGWQWLERLWLDTRLAVRLWARTPGFSAVAIATIGLGVGASTALVGQVRPVFWTPLPVAEPQNLRLVAWTSPRHPFVKGPNVLAGPRINGTDTFGTVSYPAYLAMRGGDRLLRRSLTTSSPSERPKSRCAFTFRPARSMP